MTEEYKDLLIKDICSRLSYEPIVMNPQIDGGFPEQLFPDSLRNREFFDTMIFDDTKIYLRPMSSMTEEERDKMRNDINKMHEDITDWLNKYHFDYRGLIKKGLALEAPEGMYEF